MISEMISEFMTSEIISEVIISEVISEIALPSFHTKVSDTYAWHWVTSNTKWNMISDMLLNNITNKSTMQRCEPLTNIIYYLQTWPGVVHFGNCYRLQSRGDNTLGSVRPSVHVFVHWSTSPTFGYGWTLHCTLHCTVELNHPWHDMTVHFAPWVHTQMIGIKTNPSILGRTLSLT